MIVGNNNMSCFTLLSIRLIYLFTLSKIIPYTTVQAQQYRFHICLGANYTTNSTYQTNLNLLLPLLSSADASKIENGYYNDTVGRNSSDTVYGSLQCRGDASLEACQICAQRGTEQINKMAGCPNSKQAIIWYDTCMLRYSNIDYFNIMQEMPAFYLSNLKDISNPDQFRPILDAFMHRLVKEALTIAGSPKFVAGETKFTNTTKVYGYVQCTEDISASDCYRCLLGAISELPDCCDAKQGGQILTPSCILRFELYPLFQSMNTPSPPPSSTNTTTPNTNGNNSSVLLVRIIVPSVIAILSVSAISFWFFCFQRKKGQSEHLVG
ncbi:hypothetical protein MKW94_004879, partial [Papaver nudicaule]|nr:hypothetical protein [Papaver nudicaule]